MFGSVLTELHDRWSHKLISQTHECHVERSFSSCLNLFLPSAATGGMPQGLVLDSVANWGWAKSHTFDVCEKWKTQHLSVEVRLCIRVLPPSSSEATELFALQKSHWFCFITSKTYPYSSVRAEAPLKGHRSWAAATAPHPNMSLFLLFCQGRAISRTFSSSSLCWLQQLIIDQPVVSTCTLLQHQRSGKVGVHMFFIVKNYLTSGCRQCFGSITGSSWISRAIHFWLSEDEAAAIFLSRSTLQTPPGQAWIWIRQLIWVLWGFWMICELSASKDMVWNPQWKKTGPVYLPHDVSHDAGRRSPAEEAGGSSRKTRRRLRLKTQRPAIKLLHKTADHKAAAYYLWVAAERMVNGAFSTFGFSTHAVLPQENTSLFGDMT